MYMRSRTCAIDRERARKSQKKKSFAYTRHMSTYRLLSTGSRAGNKASTSAGDRTQRHTCRRARSPRDPPRNAHSRANLILTPTRSVAAPHGGSTMLSPAVDTESRCNSVINDALRRPHPIACYNNKASKDALGMGAPTSVLAGGCFPVRELNVLRRASPKAPGRPRARGSSKVDRDSSSISISRSRSGNRARVA